jgi:hypothetical protein
LIIKKFTGFISKKLTIGTNIFKLLATILNNKNAVEMKLYLNIMFVLWNKEMNREEVASFRRKTMSRYHRVCSPSSIGT